MEDIIFSFPELDDGVWREQHVWMYCTTKPRPKISYTICDSDGNHEDISKRDVQALERKLNTLWLQFWRACFEEKRLLLYGYKIQTQIEKQAPFTMVLKLGPKGSKRLRLHRLRTGSGSRALREPSALPPDLLRWTELVKDKKSGDWISRFESFNDVVAERSSSLRVKCTKSHVTIRTTAFWKEPRCEKLVQRDTMRLIRRQLKNSETRIKNAHG